MIASTQRCWTKKPLGEVANVISGYAFKSSEFGNCGVPVIKIKNIRVGTVDLSEADRVAESFLNLPERYHVKAGDILISLTGSHISQPNSVVGRVAKHSVGLPQCLLNQRAGKVIVKDRSSCDMSFLYYALSEKETMRAIALKAQGAANQANVSPSQVESIEITLPSFYMQRRIASILSAYDDLIENNTRRIAALEEMARRLYEEWFVRFRFPGHEQVRMVESELGLIPEGWGDERLDELAEIKGGKQLEKEHIEASGQYPVFGGNGIQGYSSRATHNGFVIAFGRVGAYCGAIHWALYGAWLNNNSSSVVPLRHHVLILEHLLRFDFGPLRGGAAQPFISNSALAGIRLPTPSDDIAEKFVQLVGPMRELQDSLIRSNTNLRAQRDLLLPKLISGELDVSAFPEAEAVAA